MNTQFQLDPLGRLKQQIAQPNSHNKADPAVLIGRRYQYDTIGNLVRTEDQTSGSRDYTYDALGRISQSADEHYRYDPAHNLTDGSRIVGNRLTQYQGTSYRYDPLGNLIEKQQHDGETQHYRYNADNQLTEAEIHRPGQNTVLYRYRYDPIGRRIAKVHPDGNEIQYLWDGSRLLQECRKDRTYTYVYTEDRNYEPLAQITTYNGSDKAREILYYHNDQIGIPREMTDGEGNIVWGGDYSGWGKLTQEGRLKLDIHQPFRLQNQHYDEETGLHYNFFRYYDPDIGRFTQQDPIGLMGGGNLYVFAPNNQQWIDPLGLNSLAQCLNPANTIQCAEAGMISAPPVTAPTTVGGVTKGALATGTGIAAISISKVSPDAIALSNAHNSGQNYGGNCTPKEHRALTAMKMSFCNAPRSCQKKSLTDQSEIAVRESFALGCAQIRSKINNKCFAGGDQIHRDEEKEAWDVWATCRAKLKL